MRHILCTHPALSPPREHRIIQFIPVPACFLSHATSGRVRPKISACIDRVDSAGRHLQRRSRLSAPSAAAPPSAPVSLLPIPAFDLPSACAYALSPPLGGLPSALCWPSTPPCFTPIPTLVPVGGPQALLSAREKRSPPPRCESSARCTTGHPVVQLHVRPQQDRRHSGTRDRCHRAIVRVVDLGA